MCSGHMSKHSVGRVNVMVIEWRLRRGREEGVGGIVFAYRDPRFGPDGVFVLLLPSLMSKFLVYAFLVWTVKVSLCP